MQQTVTVRATPKDTVELSKNKGDTVTLSAEEVETVFAQMFTGPPEQPDASLEKVWGWTLAEYENPDRPKPWEEFQSLLKAVGKGN